MGVPKEREAGEIGGNYATLHNISQSKKDKREEAKKKGAGARIARYGRREVWTSLPPFPHKVNMPSFLVRFMILIKEDKPPQVMKARKQN